MQELDVEKGGSLLPQQEHWNKAIFEWYFGPHISGRPVYLSVDDAALKAIALSQGWLVEDPQESLRSSLSAYVDHARPFDYWDGVAERWGRSGANAPPPFIHILALTVLPATERRDTGSNTGYYRPLFEVMGIADTAARREDYRWHVPSLWRRLDAWLQANNGKHGLPTARPGTHATEYLGYSRSQAIVRSADRAAFIDFFEQAGYQAGETVPTELLLTRFERWASRASVSDRLRRALDDDDERESLAAILLHDLETWSGESRDENFRRILRIVPRLNATKRSATVVLRCPPGFGGLREGERQVAAAGDERVFVDLNITWEPRERRETFTVGGETLQFRHARIHAFEEDPILGGYTAVDRMTRGRSAWLAVAESAGATLRYLADNQFRAERWPNLSGWQIIRDVKLNPDSGAVLPDELRTVMPPSGLRAELGGGLPLGNRRYLSGGAPDLIVPECPIPLEVTVDGAPLTTVDSNNETVIGLSSVALDPGEHLVIVGDQTIRFEVAPAPSVVDERKLIWHVLLPDPPTLLDLCPSSETDEDDLRISGAIVSTEHPPRTRAASWPPAIDGWVAFGPHGEITTLPAHPTWLSQLNLSSCHMASDDIAASTDHQVEWVARVMRTRVHLRRLGYPATAETTAPPIRYFGDRPVKIEVSDAPAWEAFAGQISDSVPGFSVTPASRSDRESTIAAEPSDVIGRALSWCSERSTGSVATFVETFQWLDRNRDDRKRAYRALRSLNRLGHLEVDWHHQRWSITPTTIVAPFNAGGLAFVTGGRTNGLLSRLQHVIDDHDLDVVLTEGQQHVEAPPVALLRAGSRQELIELSHAAGLPLIIDPSRTLGTLLPTIDRMVKRGHIPGGFERRRIDIGAAGPILSAVNDDTWAGSYEHDTFGPMIYSISESGLDDKPYLVDRSTAIWYALRRQRSCPIVHDPRAQTLAVRTHFGLPLLHERSLIMSTGFLPALQRLDGNWHYVYSNVSSRSANQLKDALTR